MRRIPLIPVLLVVSLCLSVAALVWLAWLSPPAHWFDARPEEPRVAVPVSRLAPAVPVRQILQDVQGLQARLYDIESGTDSTEIELQLEELADQVSSVESEAENAQIDLDSRLTDVESRLDDVESRLDDAESELQKLTDLCDALSLSDGALYDLYLSAC